MNVQLVAGRSWNNQDLFINGRGIAMKSRLGVRRVVGFMILPALLAACGDNDNGNGGAAQPPQDQTARQAQLSSLQGEWRLPCTARGDLFSTAVLTISDQTAQNAATIYADPPCNTPIATASETSQFSIGSEIRSGVFELDQTLAQGVVTPLTLEAALGLNATSTCGKTDWSVGVARDITSLIQQDACLGIRAKDYTIYTRSGDTLQIALPTAAQTGDSPQTRPTAFTNSITFKR